jgi:hypothetical protein
MLSVLLTRRTLDRGAYLLIDYLICLLDILIFWWYCRCKLKSSIHLQSISEFGCLCLKDFERFSSLSPNTTGTTISRTNLPLLTKQSIQHSKLGTFEYISSQRVLPREFEDQVNLSHTVHPFKLPNTPKVRLRTFSCCQSHGFVVSCNSPSDLHPSRFSMCLSFGAVELYYPALPCPALTVTFRVTPVDANNCRLLKTKSISSELRNISTS